MYDQRIRHFSVVYLWTPLCGFGRCLSFVDSEMGFWWLEEEVEIRRQEDGNSYIDACDVFPPLKRSPVVNSASRMSSTRLSFAFRAKQVAGNFENVIQISETKFGLDFLGRD